MVSANKIISKKNKKARLFWAISDYILIFKGYFWKIIGKIYLLSIKIYFILNILLSITLLV